MVIQAALLVAVQLQPAPLVTVTVPSTAAGEVRFNENGEMLNTHGVPGCVMVKVFPAIVSVPVRDVLLVLAATLYATFPLPVPVAPTPIVIQASLLAAVQLHPALAVTTTFPLAAIDAVNEDESGEIE
jgi:hypothetical protein